MPLETQLASNITTSTSAPVEVKGPLAIVTWGAFTAADLEMSPDSTASTPVWIKIGTSLTGPAWLQLNAPNGCAIRFNNITGAFNAACGRIQQF